MQEFNITLDYCFQSENKETAKAEIRNVLLKWLNNGDLSAFTIVPFVDMKIEKVITMQFDKPMLVCDPCYIFDYSKPELDEAWKYFCDLMFPKNNTPEINEGLLLYKDTQLLFTGTRWGDGTYDVYYSGSLKGKIGVDAGMICAITLEDALKINPDFDVALGVVIEPEVKKYGSNWVTVDDYCLSGSISCDTIQDDDISEEDDDC